MITRDSQIRLGRILLRLIGEYCFHMILVLYRDEDRIKESWDKSHKILIVGIKIENHKDFIFSFSNFEKILWKIWILKFSVEVAAPTLNPSWCYTIFSRDFLQSSMTIQGCSEVQWPFGRLWQSSVPIWRFIEVQGPLREFW